MGNVAYTKLEIGGVGYTDADIITIEKNIGDYNVTSNFNIEFGNRNGQYDDTFALNNEVIVYADYNTVNPTTKIFRGIIEDIKYKGKGLDEKLIISGRDYGAILQDIMVSPRVYKNQEVSAIVRSLMIQNTTGTGITTNNVNVTITTLEKITFNIISLFDSLKQLAEISEYYFYIDEDKDLHFIPRDSISSGLTFDNTNVLTSDFNNTDKDIFNSVWVYGERQLTGAREIFGAQAGSVYTLDDKPSNVIVIGNPSTVLSPGGILKVDNPKTGDAKWLVDYNDKQVIITSGATAGDNIGWCGSGVTIDYQRSSPVISIKTDSASQTSYGRKDKRIVDRNILTLDEASARAQSYLDEHKDPVISGTITTRGTISITPGDTAIINIPYHNVVNQTYMVLNAKYKFTKKSCLSDTFLTIKLNKKIRNFLDLMKEQELRLRALEGATADTSLTEVNLATGSIGVEVSAYNAISRSIGSAFYFGITGHNVLNDTDSLYGDMRAGSEVISYP